MTRESLATLPYSVEEIYGIKSSGKYGALQQTYQEFYRIYGKQQYDNLFNPEIILVEDSNSGYEFWEYAMQKKNRTVVSAGGKSNIFGKLGFYEDKKVLVIADGAAFGPEMDKVMKKILAGNEKVLYLPESFEWLILKSGVVKDKDINKFWKIRVNILKVKNI